MNTKSTGVATTAFLLIILSTTEMPNFLKLPMIGITCISFTVSLYKIYRQTKDNYSNHDADSLKS